MAGDLVLSEESLKANELAHNTANACATLQDELAQLRALIETLQGEVSRRKLPSGLNDILEILGEAQSSAEHIHSLATGHGW